jgi:hypothetical protein
MPQQYLSTDPTAGERIAPAPADVMQTLSSLQQMANPSAMRAHGNEPPVDNYSTDPRTGAHVTRVPHGKIPVLDSLGEGYVQGGPVRMLQALRDLADGNYAKSGYDAIAGGMTTAAPFELPAAIGEMGLLRTGATLAAGAVGDVAGQGVARGLNATDDRANLMGILTSLLTGGVTAKATEGATPMSVGQTVVKGYDAVRHPLRTVADTVVDAVRKSTAETPSAPPPAAPAPAPRTTMIDLATRAAKGDEEAKAILAILRPGRSGGPVVAPPATAPAPQTVSPAPAAETSTPTPRGRGRTTAASPAATPGPQRGRAKTPTADGAPSAEILSDPRERAAIEQEAGRLMKRGMSPDKVVESIVTQLQLNQRLGGVTAGEASAKVAHWMRTGKW